MQRDCRTAGNLLDLIELSCQKRHLSRLASNATFSIAYQAFRDYSLDIPWGSKRKFAMARPVNVSAQIQVLLDEKGKHVEALSRINQTLDGIAAMIRGGNGSTKHSAAAVATAPSAAAPTAAPRAKRGRRRRQFGITAADFILAFVKEQKKPTTKEINAHWKSVGRPFTADVPLGKLVKDKKLKRTPLVGERGSRYSLA